MDEANLQHLKLAFAFDFARKIVNADGAESYEEFRMLGAAFPRPLLEQAGFLDEDGMLDPAFRDHRDMALQILPGALSDEEKTELMQLLWEASAIDEVDVTEISVLTDAGIALGLAEEQIPLLIADFASA